MATSSSVDYAETTATIIKDAYAELGAVDLSESVEAAQSDWAKRKLNRVLKMFQGAGVNIWRETEGSITLVADQASFTMSATGSPDVAFRPLRISSIRYRDTNLKDRPMLALSRQEYFDLPVKTTSGTPTNYYYDAGLGTGTLYIWPVLATINATTAETLKLTYSRTIEDMDGSADNPDLPQEWYEAIILHLAASICPGVFPGNVQLLASAKANAKEAFDITDGFDQETTSVFFTGDTP